MQTVPAADDDFEDAPTDARRLGADAAGVVTGAGRITLSAAVVGDTNPDPEVEFRKRGINKSVWGRRPYLRYTPTDFNHVLLAHAPLAQTGHIGWLTSIAKQSPGWMCVRHAPSGVRLPAEEIVPQLRPDEDVDTGGPPTIHHHPDVPAEGPVLNPYPYKDGRAPAALPDWRVLTAKEMRRHIDGKRGHRGENNPDPHWHESRGKYVFPPGDGRAKRIDMHPDARQLFETATRAFLVMEGQWKADALLTRGEAVLSVPSVTLWTADELEETARHYLTDKDIVIGIDADGHRNPAVMSQARYLKTHLESLRLGGNICIAAPPDDVDEHGKLLWKGIDDYLGHGYETATFTDGNRGEWVHSPDGLHVFERESPGLDQWKHSLVLQGLNGTAVNRLVRMLRFLALHADRDGQIPRTLVTIARVMGCGRKAARATLLELRDLGVIDIEGSDEAKEDRWVGRRYIDPEYGWVDPPLITIRPDYRARDFAPVTLWEWCAGSQGDLLAVNPHRPTSRGERIAFARFVNRESFEQIAKHEGVSERTVKATVAQWRDVSKLLQAYNIAVFRDNGLTWKQIGTLTGHSIPTAKTRYEFWQSQPPEVHAHTANLVRVMDQLQNQQFKMLLRAIQFGEVA